MGLSPRLDEWRQAYRGELQEWAFPEPFIGDLLGSPRIVLLANNPGIAHEELQAQEGVFAGQIEARGFTAWAATRPYEGRESEWEKRYGPIRHNRARLQFARRFLRQSLQFRDLLNIELYPWHSLSLRRAILVGSETLREFILEPLSELGPDVPVVALGRAWADALDRSSALVESCQQFDRFHVASRRARLYTVRGGSKILVAWHSGSDTPPAAPDTALLREVWFEGGDPSAAETPPRTRLAPQGALHDTSQGVPRQTTTRSSASSAPNGRRRFASVEELEEWVQSTRVRALVSSLREWVSNEFRGDAVADLRIPGTGQIRLRVLGEAAQIGWDFKQRWISVWVNEPLPGDLDILHSSLSNPQSAKLNPSGYVSFRIHDEADAQELRALIKRHVAAARRDAGVA